jgi:hypothetical protein
MKEATMTHTGMFRFSALICLAGAIALVMQGDLHRALGVALAGAFALLGVIAERMAGGGTE